MPSIFSKIQWDKKYLVNATNFLLVMVLFVFAFTGSMISIASVEMAEAKQMLNDEMELIKLDSSRISVVRITLGEKKIPIDCENRIIADQYVKQDKITYFLELMPLINKIDFLSLPDKIILSISATFMGLLGAMIMLIKESTYDNLSLTPELVVKRAALGFSSGLLVIVLSYVLPSVITFDSDVNIQIESLTTFSLLAGMFFKRLLERVSKKME